MSRRAAASQDRPGNHGGAVPVWLRERLHAYRLISARVAANQLSGLDERRYT